MLCHCARRGCRRRIRLLGFRVSTVRSCRIDVSSVHRDTFPPIELMLRDPKGRTIGAGSSGKRIPHSQYGRVYQVPEKSSRSSVIAAEVCDTVQGNYEVTVRELDSGSAYRLSVAVDDGKNGNTARDSSYVTRLRVCRFGMRIKFEHDNASVYWLDGSGVTTKRPPCPDRKYSRRRRLIDRKKPHPGRGR